MRVLLFWHDAFLPYGEYVLRAFDAHPAIEALWLCGPAQGSSEAIYGVGAWSQAPWRVARKHAMPPGRLRTRWVGLPAWRAAVREFSPTLIIVLDEALSVNVLYAGIANRLAGRPAKVMFYGFENIVQSPPWRYLAAHPTPAGLGVFLRKTLRYALVDRGLQKLRAREVGGGLVAYGECAEVVRRDGWQPALRVQGWPINLEVFTPNGPVARLDTVPAGARQVGYVGRFVMEKGVCDLIAALPDLPEDVHAVMVGDGPALPRMLALADHLRVARRLHVVPPQAHTALASWYRAFDALALPSRTGTFWKEQYGRVLLEARACGTPVVGSRSGAIPEVIQSPAMCFDEGDIAGLCRALNLALATPAPQPLAIDTLRPERFVQAFIDLAATLP